MLNNENYNIPKHTYEALKKYVEQKIPTGGFLFAILTNNLFEAASKADIKNTNKLFDICNFIYNEIPSDCWGTKDKVENWIIDN